ncbi:O-unit flippase-like protein [Aeromonas rivipollensis]|uniref:O-unit flippase-like protein n=1 Tax=Aeromonas rivipollensis TaxID=948519 RepID=UPI0038CFDD0C
MRHVVSKNDILWGYLSQFLTIGSNLLLLPFILIYLSAEDIGVWYVFITMVSLVQLLEFGLLPTISRYISYIYAGANEILEGDVVTTEAEKINHKLLISVIHASKKIYLKLSIISFIVIFFGGTYYLSTLDYRGDTYDMYASWCGYGLSTIILFYFGYYNAMLKGRGDQTMLNKIVVISKLTSVFFTIPFLIMGFGLVSVAFGVLASAIVDRVLVRRAIDFKQYSLSMVLNPDSISTKDYTRVIWSKAKLMGLVQVGNFLTTRCSLFIVSSYIGLDAAAKYGFTLQVTSVAVIVASMYFGLQMPRLSSEHIRGDLYIVRKIFSKALGVSWAILFLLCIFIMSVGPIFLSFFTKNVELLPTGILCVFLTSAMLEMNHSLCTAFLTTKNKFDFAFPIFATGVLIVIFSYILGSMYGLWGVVISQLLCQLLYNNWKWPLTVFSELNMSFKDPIFSLKK